MALMQEKTGLGLADPPKSISRSRYPAVSAVSVYFGSFEMPHLPLRLLLIGPERGLSSLSEEKSHRVCAMGPGDTGAGCMHAES